MLLASYTPLPKDGNKIGNAGIAAAVVEGDHGCAADMTEEDAALAAAIVEGDSDEEGAASQTADRKRRYDEARKKAGKCSVCKYEHTFKTRWDNLVWPSDRFITCRKFNDMSSKQRAEAIEKASGCPRCTSWTHKKAQCPNPVTDCKEVINGARCHKDHSRLVCNSGVAYCLTTKAETPMIDIF